MKLRNLFTLALAGTFWTSGAEAQQDPTRIGAGQLPYIMVILDTSGSMEYTDAGDETYPERSGDEWVPGANMGLDPSAPSAGPDRFGSCFIWEPQSCGDYQRPGWRISPDIPEWGWDLITDSDQSHLMSRWNDIRGNTSMGVRLDPLSQPRHITMKEILTGDMVLWTRDQIDNDNTPLNPSLAPGCWFVPRQRDASIQSIDEQNYCSGENRFERLPDHAEPRPHFQEVFDTQLDNGLLDVLSTSAIFAVGMLDGYREDMDDWENDLNDDFEGSAPSGAYRSSGSEDSSNHYNLGLYQVVGPKKIDIPNSYLAEISRHVQVALVDSGHLNAADNDPFKLRLKEKGGKNPSVQGRSELGLFYSSGVREYLDEDVLAKQPIARATPLAAAVMDARQFIENDDRFTDDPYKECRAKQVVLVTDGFPDPERPGGGGNDLGSEGLAPIFGYTEIDKYNYDIAEVEIEDFVDGSNTDPRFLSRVHVVALNAGADGATAARIADKMSKMAIAGQSCAGNALGDEWKQPEGCDPDLRACLVEGQEPYVSGTYLDPDGVNADCDYPALILTPPRPGWTGSYRDYVQEALAAMLGSVVGESGVASRTRAVVSDFLDDDSLLGGGQYRVYSGSRIQGSAFWRGILNRETLPCDTSVNNSFNEGTGLDDAGLLSQAIHEDIGMQVKCGPSDEGDCSVTPRDNRRIFTSIPVDELWQFDSDNFGAPASSYDLNHPLFQFRYDLMTTDETRDEFRGTTLPGSVDQEDYLVGTRIPLYENEIEHVLDTYGDNWRDDPGLLDYFAVSDYSQLRKMFNVHRGRVPQKATGSPDSSRVLSGILNGNPIVVPPPIRDIPVESYRLYRATYGDRPTMMYVPTMDGQLHAIHVGELVGRIAVRDFVEDNSWGESADEAGPTKGASPVGTGADPFQREAWSYIPNMILRQLGGNSVSQPYWMDGSPVVKDVRLCQANPKRNQNVQACRAVRDSNDEADVLSGDQQWRTVLVQGLGEAGSGYFAMDVTRTGGLRAGASSRNIDRPDPVVLWELTPEWETMQVKALFDRGGNEPNRVKGDSSFLSDILNNLGSDCDTEEEVWSQSLMGKSVSQPEIATVVVGYEEDGRTVLEQRPVAVFGGGLPDGGSCGLSTGSAVYVVDLQTGSILRRFVGYEDGATSVPFSSLTGGSVGFTGSPTLYDSNVGAVATRGYIGDTRGRIFKIDMTDSNPQNWEMVLAVDPMDDTDIDDSLFGGRPLGPAAGKPSIAVGPSRQLIVTYGLGEPGDTSTADQAQAIISFEERIDNDDHKVNWYRVFDAAEKLTGDPLVFNSAIYFPTYAADSADVCIPGDARIYGVKYYNDPADASYSTAPVGVFDPNDPDFEGGAVTGLSVEGTGLYFQLEETLIRGLTLTLGPVCTGRGIGDGSQELDESRYAVQQPQLIAQTGAVPDSNMGTRNRAGTGSEAIGRVTKNLARKRGPVVPLNWNLIY